MSVLGLDIGGANIKGAHSNGIARSEPFSLWKNPGVIPSVLANFIDGFPGFEVLAVTMTGELSDCFTTKREGVKYILDALQSAAPTPTIRVWQTTGQFVDCRQACHCPLETAASNWHALATWAGRLVPELNSLLIDIGSTTSDIIPISAGKPSSIGFTDKDRLETQELVYTGARRTPVCALLGANGAAELFATTLDVYLILGLIPEDSANCDTADGRPATRQAAHARLARMLCSDIENFPISETTRLARELANRQSLVLKKALDQVSSRLSGDPTAVILSGSAEFLARAALEQSSLPVSVRMVSLAELFGSDISCAACAYALAVLGQERDEQR
jgi:probable H4MPT-linked C1 transfer pathway protein